ncbi:thioesterase domain-containing protein [Flavobacterium sp. TR2]|uniref:thioesterase II family protein n=1 Tax=Flavobacterium sp. TR2 TaxID=2977321 RepID=UPI0021B0C9EF|nr:thioesterase domain-containing protein [Flavobacterium sp. TR2]UWY30353.1 thioesterase domain-containing protein [Flavobacterium sp. TR2]
MKKKQLFLLHFAGGNIYSFEFLKSINTDFEMIPLELPGRGKRIKEKLLTSYQEAINDIYSQIITMLNGAPFMIYGHSLGATLALGVTDLLEKNNTPPQCLIVSGNPGPGVVTERKRSDLDRADFISMLKELGGLTEELLQSEELLDFVLPILRADFKIVEGDTFVENTIVKAPIIAVMGDLEKYAGSISNWKTHTLSEFNSYILNGNHFFIYDNADKLIQIFEASYNEYKILT